MKLRKTLIGTAVISLALALSACTSGPPAPIVPIRVDNPFSVVPEAERAAILEANAVTPESTENFWTPRDADSAYLFLYGPSSEKCNYAVDISGVNPQTGNVSLHFSTLSNGCTEDYVLTPYIFTETPAVSFGDKAGIELCALDGVQTCEELELRN